MNIGLGSGDNLAGSPQNLGLYATDWKVWFPVEGDPRHGTPDDPRLASSGSTFMPPCSWKSTRRSLSCCLKWRKAG